MAYSISYIYEIADKFTAPLQKMEGAGGKFDDKLEQVQKSLALVENKMGSTSVTTKSLSTNMKAVGDGFNSKSLAVRKSLGQIENSVDSLDNGLKNIGNNFKVFDRKKAFDKFKSGIASAKQKYEKFNTALSNFGVKFNSRVTKIQKGLGNLQNKFKSTGEKMANLQTGLAAVGAGVFLKSATDDFREFQRQLNLTKAVTGSTADEMELMKNKALEWGSQTQFSSLQVAGAMAELGKMGNKTNQIIDLMPGTMALAAAGEISMAEAATFSMQAINQMGLELSDAEMVADTFATGAANASTSVVGLASAFSNTGLAARGAGLDMNETTVALMALASQGQEGAHGGTMLKNSLLELQKMTPKVRKGFDGLGIDIDNFRDSTTGQMTDLFGLIDALKETGDVGIKALGDMFGKQALQGMSALIGTSTEKMNEFKDSMKDVSGGAERMKNDLMDGLNPMIQFESVMGNLKVIVGGFVTEAINPLLKKFNKWLGDIQQNNPQLLKMFTYFAMGITAVGAILVPLGLIISSIGSLIGIISSSLMFIKLLSSGMGILNAVMAANPVGLVVLAIVALIAIIVLLVKNWDSVKLAMGFVWEKMKAFGSWVAEGFTGIWKTSIDFLKGLLSTFLEFVSGLWLNIGIVASGVWDGIKNAFTASINFTKTVFFTFADTILSTYGNIFKTIIGLVSKVGGALGLDTSGLDGLITKVETLQANVREKSLIGGIDIPTPDIPEYGYSMGASPYIERTEEAPVPGYGAGANANANATVSVYAEKGIGVDPWKASGDLGYNMTDNYQRGAMR